MKKDVDYFVNEFEKQRKKYERIKPGNIVYGSNVMSILKLYKDLSTFEERESFRKALENMLADHDVNKRRYAVDVCLGFLVFRDAI